MNESVQPEGTVIQGLASSTQKPGLEGNWDERDGWTGAMSGGRRHIVLVEDGEADNFSGSRTGLGNWRASVGIGHDVWALVQGKEGEQEPDWPVTDEGGGEGILKVG